MNDKPWLRAHFRPISHLQTSHQLRIEVKSRNYVTYQACGITLS